MPSSHPFQLNEILELIMLTDPESLLDIGVGFGKYGFLSREYLELWNNSNEYLQWTRQIDGIEVYDPYLTPWHDRIYNRIFRGNALEILPGITQRYDLILMIDVLEHFTYEEGLKIIEHCMRCGKNIIVSVPAEMSDQGEVYGNPYETHKYQWIKKDFLVFGKMFFLSHPKSLICFAGEDSERIRLLLKRKNRREKIIRILDFFGLKKIFRRIFFSFRGSGT